jgi:transcriptional regulator with XRE-family HTH domain
MKNREKNIIGTRLAQARKSANLTQLDLSRKVSVFTPIDRAGIAKIEVGLRCVYDYELLAFSKVLGVDVQWLLTGWKRR